MDELSRSIFGVICVVLALLGLVLAARSVDIGIAIFGYGLIAFGILFGGQLIKRHCDLRFGKH